MKIRTGLLMVGGTILGAVLCAGNASAAMTADQVRRQVEQVSGDKVIKIEPRQYDTLKAFAVTVMGSGGNRNGAFEVYTVIIDSENGMPVPAYRLPRRD